MTTESINTNKITPDLDISISTEIRPETQKPSSNETHHDVSIEVLYDSLSKKQELIRLVKGIMPEENFDDLENKISSTLKELDQIISEFS